MRGRDSDASFRRESFYRTARGANAYGQRLELGTTADTATRLGRNPACSSLRRLGSAHNLRAWKILEAPGGDVAKQFAEAQTVVAEPVGVPTLIGRVGHSFDQALRAQRAQPRRQDVGGDPLRRAQELVEVPLAAEQVPHEQQRPAIADDVQGAGDGTVGATHRSRCFRAPHDRPFYLPSARVAIESLHNASDVAGAGVTARAASGTQSRARSLRPSSAYDHKTRS